MREIPIFIASSVREFEQERKELFSLLDTLNATFGKRGAKLVWNPPETSSRTLSFGGKQLDFDAFIPISEFFILIVGQRVGPYTRHEYELALERLKRTRKPKILPCFLETVSQEARDFRDSIRQADIGVQYVDFYKDFGDIKNQILFELTNYVVNIVETDDDETEADNRLDRIKRKIHTLRGEIKYLKTLTVTQETVAEITYQYAEMARLVRKYKVEPDTLLDYMGFLSDQHQYDTAIEVGRWLEGFYQMENPGEEKLAMLKNLLGVCYNDMNQHEQAERYYREALEINRRLAAENPAYEQGVFQTYNNIAVVLENENRKKEAENYYRETLEFYKRLAKANPAAFECDLAIACNNLAALLSDTNRRKEAETHYREAIEIYRRLAKANPAKFEFYVAASYNNLAGLMYATNRIEATETYYREALKILKRLAKANPVAFEPYVAMTCYNLGRFELQITTPKPGVVRLSPRKQGDWDTPRRYFEEALSIDEKYPHLAQNAASDRAYLAMLPPHLHSNLDSNPDNCRKWRRFTKAVSEIFRRYFRL